jgi:HAD superfamily hydrolase (TIGR01509 family)
MTSHIKAVLFDIDDTLFDRQAAQHEVLRKIVSEFPTLFRGLDDKEITKAFLKADLISSQEFASGASIDASRELRSRKFLEFLHLAQEYSQNITSMYWKCYPLVEAPIIGAQELVKKLATDYRIGIISNGSPDVQYTKLDNLGVKNYLDCVVLSEELGIRKPDLGIFQEASKRLKVQTGQCIFVGDSYDADIVGAKNSGMQACWFNPRQSVLPGNVVEPDFEISALDQLTGILSQA